MPENPRTSLALRVATGLLLVTVPIASALLAVAYAPPATVEIAGEPVTVRPVLGQTRTELFGGALLLPQHARLSAVGLDVGLDVDANWNNLVPSDKQTRTYLTTLWENPQPAIDLIERAARRHLLVWATTGFLVGLGAELAVVLVLRQRRRRLATYSPEQAAFVERHNRRLRRTLLAGGIAAALVVDVLALQVYLRHDDRAVVGTPSLDGTALEGMQVKGLLADAMPFLSVLRPRSQFYDDVSAHLEDAIAAEPTLVRGDGEVVFVMAEDFEDVNGMARQVGLAAQLVDADFIALTGDLTFAGKPIETYILDTIDYYSEKRPVYFAPGLHDTTAITDAAKARGWHVADGRTHIASGLRILTAADPRISTVGDLGSGTVLRDPDVDTDTFVTDTAQASCDDTTDFVLLHDHLLGRQVAESGCQQVAVLDGRSYDFVGPQRVTTASGGVTTEFTTGSAGGHTDTTPDPGVIEHPARFPIFYVDRETLTTSYAVVTVHPDASVSLTSRLPLGRPYAED